MRIALPRGARLKATALVPLLLCAALHAQSSALQKAVDRGMSGRNGAAAVLDLATGKLLASYHLDTAARRLASPGSALKPFTLLALLQSGKLSGSDALVCPRKLSVDGHNLTCTHPEVQQPLSASTALAYSCNNFFTRMATRLTPTELYTALLHDGLGSTSGLVPQEAAGTVMLATSPTELQLQAIGEWGVQVTPLELLRGYERLARLSIQRNPQLAPLFDGLEASVAYGMANLAQPPAPMTAAGKTGTSVAAEGSWRHAWFAGYAPADAPRIVVVVFLEKGSGPADAAAVARQLFTAYAESRAPGAPH